MNGNALTGIHPWPVNKSNPTPQVIALQLTKRLNPLFLLRLYLLFRFALVKEYGVSTPTILYETGSRLNFRQLINWSAEGDRGRVSNSVGLTLGGGGCLGNCVLLMISLTGSYSVANLRTPASFYCRRVTRSNLAELQTFPLEKPYGSRCDLRFSLVFWISLYRDCPMVQALHVEYCVHFVLKTNRQTDKAISISDSLSRHLKTLHTNYT